jgi:hypothetical protein
MQGWAQNDVIEYLKKGGFAVHRRWRVAARGAAGLGSPQP